jgi:hypothetical protein
VCSGSTDQRYKLGRCIIIGEINSREWRKDLLMVTRNTDGWKEISSSKLVILTGGVGSSNPKNEKCSENSEHSLVVPRRGIEIGPPYFRKYYSLVISLYIIFFSKRINFGPCLSLLSGPHKGSSKVLEYKNDSGRG